MPGSHSSTTGAGPGSKVNSAWQRSGDISWKNRGARSSISTRGRCAEPAPSHSTRRGQRVPWSSQSRHWFGKSSGQGLPAGASARNERFGPDSGKLDTVRVLQGRLLLPHPHHLLAQPVQQRRHAAEAEALGAQAGRHDRAGRAFVQPNAAHLDPPAGHGTGPLPQRGAIAHLDQRSFAAARAGVEFQPITLPRAAGVAALRFIIEMLQPNALPDSRFHKRTFVRAQGGHRLGQPGRGGGIGDLPARAGPGEGCQGRERHTPAPARRRRSRPGRCRVRCLRRCAVGRGSDRI